MENPNHEAVRKQLTAFVERIETVEGELEDLKANRKSIYDEAKSNGFDPKILRKIIQIRRKEEDERLEEESLLDTYMRALGMKIDE